MTAPWNDARAYLPEATRFAEQHQIDPDEAYKLAVFSEIRDGLRLLGYGAVGALVFIAMVWS
jgi:hypothetical protein